LLPISLRFPPGTVDKPIDYSGFLGGFYGGYNYQINQFVRCIVNGDVAHHNDVINWIATATGRGIAFRPSLRDMA
jgi:hypothetical protein